MVVDINSNRRPRSPEDWEWQVEVSFIPRSFRDYS